jgi:hypothetical protein
MQPCRDGSNIDSPGMHGYLHFLSMDIHEMGRAPNSTGDTRQVKCLGMMAPCMDICFDG